MERVTRQYAEVLRAGNGLMRVTRQYVEVLRATMGVFDVSLTDDVGITDTLEVTHLQAVPATFSDDVGITDSLEVVHLRVLRVSLVDDLGLVQDTEEEGPRYVQLQSAIGLHDQLIAQHCVVHHVAITDTLNLIQSLRKPIFVNVTQTLTLSDQVVGVNQFALPSQDVGLADQIVAFVVHNTQNVVTLTDTISCELIASRNVTHDLGLKQSLTYILEHDQITQDYTPFVGSSSDTEYVPPTTVAPVLSRAKLTLTYPYVSPTTTLVLRNPEFGNLDRLTFNRINRKTRGGTLVVFADPNWPKIQTLQVKFTYLTDQQAADLLAFFQLSLGKEIGLLDYEGRQWRGIITTPDPEISNPGRGDHSVGFDFEGVLA